MRMNYQNKKVINFNLKELSDSGKNNWTIEKIAIQISKFIDNHMDQNTYSGKKEKFDLNYIKSLFDIESSLKEIMIYVSKKLRSQGYTVSIKNNYIHVTWYKY